MQNFGNVWNMNKDKKLDRKFLIIMPILHTYYYLQTWTEKWTTIKKQVV